VKLRFCLNLIPLNPETNVNFILNLSEFIKIPPYKVGNLQRAVQIFHKGNRAFGIPWQAALIDWT